MGGREYKEQIDFSLVKKWLQYCESSHDRCRPQEWHTNLKPLPGLRLIDVHTQCLVEADVNPRYVALSYVWGVVPMFQTKKASVQALYAPGGLGEVWNEISTTVKDAIQAVKELGEQYLWTDAICIVQDDAADKLRLIKDMDTIYAGAYLTIVATEGKHANAGLPGVLPDSRQATEIHQVSSDLSLLLAQAPIWNTLNICPWSKRVRDIRKHICQTVLTCFGYPGLDVSRGFSLCPLATLHK